MSYWQPADRDRGNIGCAIVIPGTIEEFATEAATLPKLTQVGSHHAYQRRLIASCEFAGHFAGGAGQTISILFRCRLEQEQRFSRGNRLGGLRATIRRSPSRPPESHTRIGFSVEPGTPRAQMLTEMARMSRMMYGHEIRSSG